jgi:glycosyltransferase involved in cell wall biosynthesis
MSRQKLGVFTIASKNYLAFARVLLQSVAKFHPEYRLYLFLADKVDGTFDPAAEYFEVVQSDQIGIRHHDDMALRYDIMEFNTAIKPFVFQWLFRTTDLDSIIYLDPDIRVYSHMTRLEDLLSDGHSAVLTPHITRPVEDGRVPNDYNMLQAGVFNLGFAAFSRCSEAEHFLAWWGRRLETQACVDLPHNLFTDQRWCDLAPCFMDRLHILKEPGFNVAYWNLTERSLTQSADNWLVNGEPLVFFHFSGIDISNTHILSKHQDRFDLAHLPECAALLHGYREAVLQAGWENARRWEYAYSRAGRALTIPTIVRQLFRHRFRTPQVLPVDDLAGFLISLCTERDPEFPGTPSAPISALMAFIYHQRKDLQAAFNLSSFDGRSALRSWIDTSGMREYGLAPEYVTGQSAAPGHATPDGEQAADVRPRKTTSSYFPSVLATAFDADQQANIANKWRRLPLSVQRFLAPVVSFLLTNRPDNAAHTTTSALTTIDGIPGSAASSRLKLLDDPAPIRQLLWDGRHISVLMHAIWSMRPDLQSSFDLTTMNGQYDFIGWYDKFQAEFDAASSESSISFPTPAAALPGANLIGYARAEIGMGEHVRMTAAAFRTTPVPFAVIDFNVGLPGAQDSATEQEEASRGNPYAANIFHVNADQIFVAYQHFGHEFFSRRYNIGYWAWELAACPAEMLAATAFIDELWAPSRFIQAAFRKCSGVPVEYMPLCVMIPDFPPLGRNHFHLPEDAFTFLYTFDCLSFLERKNPLAAIAAFRLAFPQSSANVRLVLKVMNCNPKAPLWKALIATIDADPRIVVINRTLSRPELLALVNTCDCYVSLHRSEGFGRGPAEAMCLAKPVIATNYSGNTDFTTDDNSCPVGYKLIPVESGQYPHFRGQQWADPDIEHAAWYMKKLILDNAYARQLGERARLFMRNNFSQEVVGERYRSRLRKLNLVS